VTTAPFVELRFNPTDLRPGDLPQAAEFLGSPAEAMEAALAVSRHAMVEQIREQVRGLAEPTHAQLLRIADLAWEVVAWKFRRMSAPMIADAYISAYRDANAGDVPMSVIYDLAEKHSMKVGDYFHTTSKEALAEGFNTLVNRRIPAKAAADRVLDGFGLTTRQMRAYTAATQFNTPVSDVMPRSIKARARAYVDKAFTQRSRKLARQEEHNISEQAKQFAWMWLQDKGRLGLSAQKRWVTAKDEKVCPICGPLHGKKVGITEQFKTKEGAFWAPGLHPNCRCEVKLVASKTKLEKRWDIAKADDWEPKLHPRGGDPKNKGRFSRKPKVAEKESLSRLQEFLDTAQTEEKVAEDQGLDFSQTAGLDFSQTAGLDFSKPRPLDFSIQAKPEVDLSQPEPGLDFSGVTKPGLSGLRSTGQSLTLTNTRARLALRPSLRDQLDAITVQAAAAEARRNAVPEPEQKPRGRPKAEEYGTYKFEKPVFGVVRGTDFADDLGTEINMTATTELMENDVAAAADASKLINTIVDAEVHRRWNQDGGVVDLYDDEGNPAGFASLTVGQVQEALDWYAINVNLNPAWENEWEDHGLEVSLHDEEGVHIGDQTLSFKEITENWGLDPHAFTVHVVWLEQGHDSHLGGTWMDQAHTTYGTGDTYNTNGIYDVDPETTSNAQAGKYAVRLMRLSPRLDQGITDVREGDYRE
jgi:hypothetical protein